MWFRRKPPTHELPEGLRYRAFLSYRSRDRKQAEWLHRKLESFRIPRALVGRQTTRGVVPPRLGPIFRDRDDLRSAADLETIIAENLGRSEQLVVLCSPAAVEPEAWVGREIEIFRERRPGAEVHAIIGAGEPPACFPGQLITIGDDGDPQEPLAADLRPPKLGGDGRSRAVAKLAAGLLGLDFDDLWRRRRRRLIRIWIAATAAVVLPASAYAGWLAYSRTGVFQAARMTERAPLIQASGSDGSNGAAAWAEALALVGRGEEARRFARGQLDAETRAAAFAAVGKRLAQRHDSAGAGQAFEGAIAAVRQAREDQRLKAYCGIVEAVNAWAASGGSSGAVPVLQRVRGDLPPELRGSDFCAIAIVLARAFRAAGRRDLAERTLLSARPHDQPSSLAVAREFAAVGDRRSARRLLDQGAHTPSREYTRDFATSVRLDIASGYFAAGDSARGQEWADSAIAFARRMRGRPSGDEGREHVRYFTSYGETFVERLAEVGRAETIGEFIRREGSPVTRVNMLGRAAKALAHRNAAESRRLRDLAIREAEAIQDSTLRAEALVRLSDSIDDPALKLRLADGALAASRGSWKPSGWETDVALARTRRLTEISKVLSDAGQRGRAAQIAAEADQASREASADPSPYLPDLADALSRAGRFHTARIAAERAVDGDHRLLGYAAILRELGRRDDPVVARLLAGER
jgi:hypothetical protein